MNELEKTQLMLKDILKFFHDFCVKESLCYYAIGGTAIGAARHRGFIPWDDDIDIGMPRPDYERFISIFNKKNADVRYRLEGPDSADPLFIYPHSKLYDTQTTLIEQIRHPLKRGLFIDIFPIDGVGNSEDDSLRLFRKINRLFFLRNMRMIRISSERGLYKNALLFLFQILPKIILDEKKIVQRINSLCQMMQYESSVYVANLMGVWGKKEIVPKAFLGKQVLYPFEDIQIFCPENTDAYLTHVYGDWRTPPPKEKQVTHHAHYLNLNKSYLE